MIFTTKHYMLNEKIMRTKSQVKCVELYMLEYQQRSKRGKEIEYDDKLLIVKKRARINNVKIVCEPFIDEAVSWTKLDRKWFNAAMAYVEKYVHDLHGDKLVYQKQEIGDKDRYNLIIKNTETPDVILAGHVDVVPSFSQDQFVPKIDGNKLYGRGAVDMKSWVAINIALIDFMLQNNIKFWVLCYADEEYNFLGMKSFSKIYNKKISPKLCIVTEPTDTKIYTGFRGVASISLEIQWVSAHSARKHLWINAISSYVDFVDELEKHIQSKDTYGYTSLTNLAWIEGWIEKEWKIIWQDNIVPNKAKWTFSIRLGNYFTQEDLNDFIQNYAQEKWIKIDNIQTKIWYNPLLQEWLLEKYSKYWETEEWYTFGYSDIQLAKEFIGGDCLLVGPGPFAKAHQNDEYVEIDSIEKAKSVIEKILLDVENL